MKCSCWRWRWHWQLCIIMILHCNSSSSSLLSCSLSYVMLNPTPLSDNKAGWRNLKTIKKDEEWEFYHEIWRPIFGINNTLEKKTRKPRAACQWSTATWPKDKIATFLACFFVPFKSCKSGVDQVATKPSCYGLFGLWRWEYNDK